MRTNEKSNNFYNSLPFHEPDVTLKSIYVLYAILHLTIYYKHCVFSVRDAAACGRRLWRKWNLPASVRRYLPSGRLPEATPVWKRCTWTPTTGRCAWPCRAIGPGHPYSLTMT